MHLSQQHCQGLLLKPELCILRMNTLYSQSDDITDFHNLQGKLELVILKPKWSGSSQAKFSSTLNFMAHKNFSSVRNCPEQSKCEVIQQLLITVWWKISPPTLFPTQALETDNILKRTHAVDSNYSELPKWSKSLKIRSES